MRSIIALLLIASPAYAQVSGPSGNYSLSLPSAGSLPSLSAPLTGPAGNYTTSTSGATTITMVTDVAGNTVVTITWKSGTPGPSPVPPPIPAPNPVPSGTNLYVVAFFDKTVSASDAQIGLLGADSVDRINAAVRSFSTAKTTYVSADVSSPTLGGWLSDKSKTPCILVLQTDANNKGTVIPGYPIPLPIGATLADVETALIARIKAMRGASDPLPPERAN